MNRKVYGSSYVGRSSEPHDDVGVAVVVHWRQRRRLAAQVFLFSIVVIAERSSSLFGFEELLALMFAIFADARNILFVTAKVQRDSCLLRRNNCRDPFIYRLTNLRASSRVSMTTGYSRNTGFYSNAKQFSDATRGLPTERRRDVSTCM